MDTKLTVRVTKEMKANLKRYARKREQPIQVIVRKALTQYLPRDVPRT